MALTSPPPYFNYDDASAFMTPQVLVGKLLRRLLAGENRDRFYAEARSTEDDIAATGGGGGAARRQQQSK